MLDFGRIAGRRSCRRRTARSRPAGPSATFQRVPCLSVQPNISLPKPIENASAGILNSRATR